MPSTTREYFLQRRAVILLAFLLSALSVDAQEWYNIESVGSDSLVYGSYQNPKRTRIEMPEFLVSQDCIGDKDPLNTIYRTVQDFKRLLLEGGCAELRNPEKASEDYRQAQDRAKAGRKGLWAKRLPPPQTIPTQLPRSPEQQAAPSTLQLWFTSLIGWSVDHWVEALSVLSSLGLTGLVIALVLERRNRRRPRLVLLGEPLSGKTGVCVRLLYPDATKERFLELTRERTKLRKLIRTARFIPFGELRIYPIYSDLPGPEYGLIYDELSAFRLPRGLIQKPRLVIFVLSPTQSQTVSGDSIDSHYIDVQLGVIRAQLQAILQSKKTLKPKGTIIFINKFDLFSEHAPDDTNARQSEDKLKGLFASHIESVQTAGKSVGIQTHVIVGSALRNWGCREIKEAIAGSYDKSWRQ
jgi:hypothetical protein